MRIFDYKNMKLGMWFKTTTGHVSKIIDLRFSIGSNDKFPIIYSDDNKTCWSIDHIEQFRWILVLPKL